MVAGTGRRRLTVYMYAVCEKVIASVLFAVGHGLQCRGRRADSADWSYIVGCSPCLTAAFAGTLFGKPAPAMQLIGGVLLLRAYLPLYARAKRAGSSTTLPRIGLVAALLLVWGGAVAILMRRGTISRAPFIPLLGWALLTAMVFGAGNALRLAQLLQSNDQPAAHVLWGQASKVAASWLLVTSNALLLDFHKKLPRDPRAWHAASAVAAWTLCKHSGR